ncbi:hypothetical protein [Kitasatospora sp. DSM 101779]|uniref:hypothetical protein n=1 Tax=Kitasatospora sp. DSM 101779 TaxID=2853165 RepID=UPI002955AF6B|nr:hypothetical protein [Kitasatospora sp. DSM 101779]
MNTAVSDYLHAVVEQQWPLLVVVLDRPFAGDLRVSPAPFKQSALAQFWTVQPESTASH